MDGFSVIPVTKKQADALVSRRHYSRRPSVFWEAFGLERAGRIEGVVVFGQPSPPILRHAFVDRDFRLYELSRLVVQTPQKNAASFLVGSALKMLSHRPCAVVSYADTEMGHAGIVYQATNWIYTGATLSHDHCYLVDGIRTHPMTLRDRGITDPKRWAAENGIETVPPMEKHRYFFLVGTQKQRRVMLKKLRYPVVAQYPKLPRSRYDDGEYVSLYADDTTAEISALI